MRMDLDGLHGNQYRFALSDLKLPPTMSQDADSTIHHYLDSAEYSIMSTTVHELGHALGLQHSYSSDAIMYAYNVKGVPYQELSSDDIQGIRQHYGHCRYNPCKNGGGCYYKDDTPYYGCTCTANHQGYNCDGGSSSPCDSSPCKNSGTCASNAGNTGFTCTCTSSYTGSTCETPVTSTTPCSSNPCKNSGTCSNNAGNTGFTCSCTPNYTGTTCETALPCATSPCVNGGTCSNNAGNTGYTCACLPNYTGTRCETATSTSMPCDNNPCQNSGTCINDAACGGYRCECTSLYEGVHCQISKTNLISGTAGPNIMTFGHLVMFVVSVYVTLYLEL